MDEEFIFLVIIGVALWMAVRIRKLNNRVTYMEKYLQEVTKQFGHQQTTPVAQVVTPHVSSEAETSLKPEEVQKIVEETKETIQGVEESSDIHGGFIEWLKTDWLMKLGGLLIIFGLAWFVNYAFSHDWIGNMGKIGIGFAVGTLILVLGRYRMNTYVSQGSILMFVGALGIILTTWAGREFYGFFNPVMALAIMFLTSCVLGVTSVVQKRLPLAYANVLLAAVAPLLTDAYRLDFSVLNTYLLVLTIVAIGVAVVTGWRQLVLASLFIICMYNAPFISDAATYGGDDTGLMFGFVFTALFFFVSVFGMRRQGTTKLYDLWTAVGTGLYLLSWILSAAALEWRVLLLVAWTLVFAFGAFIAVRIGATLGFFYAYAGVGAVLLGVATAIQLEGPALTLAFMFESFVVLFVGYRIAKKASVIPLLALPTIIPVLLSVVSMESSAWANSIVHEDSLVLLLMIIGFTGLAQYFRAARLNEPEEERMLLVNYASIAGTIASLYGIVYVWLACHALFGEEFGLIVALFVYIGIGSALYLSGRKTGQRWKRVIGGLLIGITSAYLLLVAGLILGAFGRIVAYMVIGVVLVAVAWHERSGLKKKA